MKIEDTQDADNEFPFPTPGNRSLDSTEMLLLKARLTLAVQRATSTRASVSQVDGGNGSLQQ